MNNILKKKPLQYEKSSMCMLYVFRASSQVVSRLACIPALHHQRQTFSGSLTSSMICLKIQSKHTASPTLQNQLILGPHLRKMLEDQ